MRRADNRISTSTGMKKKYRVKSKFRFITFLVIVFGLIVGISSTAFGLSNSIALTSNDTVTEYVDNGETLWSIANKYKSDSTDIRQAVYEICEANDIKADDLRECMTIIIPDTI